MSLKFICLEEKPFFVKYLNLYKKMLEKDMLYCMGQGKSKA